MRSLVLLVSVALLCGCGAQAAPDDTSDTSVENAGGEAPSPGWRWESFAGVELQVPQEYGWSTGASPLDSDWCAVPPEGHSQESPKPGVNRAGQLVLAIACAGVRPTDTLAPSVDLGRESGVGRVDLGDGWTSETVEVGGVPVTVTDDDADRQRRILASIRQVEDVDALGCTPDSPLRAPGSRPTSGPMPDTKDVTGAVLCQYDLATPGPDDPVDAEPILASSSLSSEAARELTAAVQAAPAGQGPNRPESCSPEVRLGDEIIVIRLLLEDGARDLTLRYSGCDGNGVDDGVTTRELTGGVLDLILRGQHSPTSLMGVVAELLPRR